VKLHNIKIWLKSVKQWTDWQMNMTKLMDVYLTLHYYAVVRGNIKFPCKQINCRSLSPWCYERNITTWQTLWENRNGKCCLHKVGTVESRSPLDNTVYSIFNSWCTIAFSYHLPFQFCACGVLQNKILCQSSHVFIIMWTQLEVPLIGF
jgi:hypothetical protein